MSCKIKIELLTDEQIKKTNDELVIEIEPSKYDRFSPPTYIYPMNMIGEFAYIPFSYAYTSLSLDRPPRKRFYPLDLKFSGILREQQLIVKKEALKQLNKTGSIIMSMYPGFGKTYTSICLACIIKLKPIIIVHKLILVEQWKTSINTVCPGAVVQYLTAKSELNEDADFYIMNAINVSKKDADFYKKIGCVIVDECHLIMAEMLSKCMTVLCPRYVIGLSATPYRNDGLNQLLDFYFGEYKIVRKLWKEHVVNVIKTKIAFPVELANNGKINWGALLNSQALDEKRNDMIVKIVRKYKDRNFLILVKRVEQGKILSEKLLEFGETVASLLGSVQEYDATCRILIGTNSKVGTGFDHKKLDTLILAADLQDYFIQFLGRIFRREDAEPIVFDIVDKHPILTRHFSSRRKVYQEHGGMVKEFDIKTLDE